MKRAPQRRRVAPWKTPPVDVRLSEEVINTILSEGYSDDEARTAVTNIVNGFLDKTRGRVGVKMTVMLFNETSTPAIIYSTGPKSRPTIQIVMSYELSQARYNQLLSPSKRTTARTLKPRGAHSRGLATPRRASKRESGHSISQRSGLVYEVRQQPGIIGSEGCSTSGLSFEALALEGVPRSIIRKHVSTLPKTMLEQQSVVTVGNENVDGGTISYVIATQCHRGRLVTHWDYEER